MLEDPNIIAIRLILLVILFLGMVGSGTELVLLGHSEDYRQWIPLVLLGAGLIVCTWQSVNSSVAALRLMRWLMIGFVIGGGLGIFFHYQGLAEFKLESHPSLRGWTLFWQAIRGKNPPLLAPGALIQLGLVGLAYTYKQPALSRLKGN